MPIDLSLLDDVRWQGRPLVGERVQALLAALVLARRTVSAERLVAEVWGDDEPANPVKALQVLVSRTRAVVGARVLATEGGGYRLDVPPERIDADRLHELAGRARALLGEPLWTLLDTPPRRTPSPRQLAAIVAQLEKV